MMQKCRTVQILQGHRAVWINDAEGCLGRFGQMGIDVHRTLAEQEAGEPECLFCTHGPTNKSHWQRFVAAMLRYHRVDLSHLPVPHWLVVGAHTTPCALQNVAD